MAFAGATCSKWLYFALTRPSEKLDRLERKFSQTQKRAPTGRATTQLAKQIIAILEALGGGIEMPELFPSQGPWAGLPVLEGEARRMEGGDAKQLKHLEEEREAEASGGQTDARQMVH